ncbi:DUF2837 family protein [Vibrio parahaemolyticus]|nr:DUF2837 family protein [Vibrio parahaemolyticus]
MHNLILSITILIAILFSLIHFLEYSSFLSRISGILTGSKVTSYTVQQTTFVLTRFFFVAMMPLIGFIVDSNIKHQQYLIMVHFSLLLASVFYLLILFRYAYVINYFSMVIMKYQENGSLLLSLLTSFKNKNKLIDMGLIKKTLEYIKYGHDGKRLFLGSAVVFCCYSIGVFLSFFAALYFYDYRSSIGQLSGVINALATVILTFYIEPKISIAIDKNDDHAKEKVIILLLGRFIGVSLIAQLIVLSMWLI